MSSKYRVVQCNDCWQVVTNDGDGVSQVGTMEQVREVLDALEASEQYATDITWCSELLCLLVLAGILTTLWCL